MKKILSCLVLIFIAALFVTVNVIAASGTVYNIVTCPGEDMSDEIQINFHSATSLSSASILYTTVDDTEYANAKSFECTDVTFSKTDFNPVGSYEGFDTPRKAWTAHLTDLTPETKYMYRIISGSDVLSTDYKFETCSTEDKEFSFLFMTDPQYYNEQGALRFNVMTEKHIVDNNIKFTFITGDISDKGGSSSYWDLFYNKSSLQKIPFATTVGNHEYYDKGTTTTDNTIYNYFFNNPKNGPESVKGSSYYFTYNDALFIMLDSEVKGKLEEQQEWFRSVCNSVRASYIIVGTHRSCYAGAEYYSDGQLYLSQWGSVFDECAVDLVLSGHDHMYARTKLLYNDQVTAEPYKGTTYILGGSAGIKYYSKKNDSNMEKWDCYFDQTTCCTVITLGEKSMKIKTYNYDGDIKDSKTISRKRFGEIDETYTKEQFEQSFTIEKNLNDLADGTIRWSEKGYGLVNAISFKNLNSGLRIGAVQFINDSIDNLRINDGFWIGEVNNIVATISYSDGTEKDIQLEFDNTIDWGSFSNLQYSNITSDGVTISWDQDINQEFAAYIKRMRITRGTSVVKNVNFKNDDLTHETYTVVLEDVMQPEETYTFNVQALNNNLTVIWEDSFTITSKRYISEDDQYQMNLASIAIKSAIDSLLNSLK